MNIFLLVFLAMYMVAGFVVGLVLLGCYDPDHRVNVVVRGVQRTVLFLIGIIAGPALFVYWTVRDSKIEGM